MKVGFRYWDMSEKLMSATIKIGESMLSNRSRFSNGNDYSVHALFISLVWNIIRIMGWLMSC